MNIVDFCKRNWITIGSISAFDFIFDWYLPQNYTQSVWTVTWALNRYTRKSLEPIVFTFVSFYFHFFLFCCILWMFYQGFQRNRFPFSFCCHNFCSFYQSNLIRRRILKFIVFSLIAEENENCPFFTINISVPFFCTLWFDLEVLLFTKTYKL